MYWVIFSRIAQLWEQYGESTLPILISRKDNTGVVIENVCIVTQVGIYNEIQPEPLGNPSRFALRISLGLRAPEFQYNLFVQPVSEHFFSRTE